MVKIKFFWIMLLFSILLSSITFAVPGIPHQFYGTITFNNGEKVGAGFILKAYVDGEVAGTTYTLDGKYGYNPFIFFVTDPDNNREGKTISFKLYDPATKHTYSIVQTATFTNGAYTRLDLKTTENYIPPVTARRGGGYTPPYAETAESNETEEEPNIVEEKSELDEIKELIASNKIEEAKEALSKIEEKQRIEIEDIYNSKTLIETLSITFDDLSAIGLSFEEYQKALKDLKTVKELIEIAKNTEDLETKLRLISTIELLKEQIKDKIPEIKQIKETSGTIETTQKEISYALSIATNEKVKSLINSLSNKPKVSVEKQIKVYRIRNKQTGKEIYKSKITIKISDANIEIIEIIPKEIVDNANKIVFKGLLPEILQEDPIIRWTPKTTEEKIEYILPVKIDKTGDTITLAVKKNFCGDGICEENENCSTCEIDCGVCPSKTSLPTGYVILTNPTVLKTVIAGILIAILIVILVILSKKKSKKVKSKNKS